MNNGGQVNKKRKLQDEYVHSFPSQISVDGQVQSQHY